MDLNVPLDPTQFGHLRVSTMRRTQVIGPLHCIVCRREYDFGVMTADDPRLCKSARCWQLARELGWIE